MASPVTKEQVLDAAGKFIELAAAAKDVQAMEHIQTQLAQFRLGLFRIVVVGEVKKGKSSFINALLGEPTLLPTESDVATSTVYKLMYGTPKKIKVFARQDGDDSSAAPAPIEIAEDELKDYGTEDGNPNNKKNVDFIGIQLPHPLLKDGVAIVDTPGLGGLFQKHREITWRYIPNADAVFFVLDSVEALASKTEMEYLSKLRELSPLIFFVQTKIDLVEEAQWKTWRDRNLDIISEHLQVPKDKLIYFPVSAKLKFAADANHSSKHLDRSGYSSLLYFLYNRLLSKKQDQLGKRLLVALSVEATGIHRKLADHLQIAATETKEGLDTLEKEFIATKAKYEQWKGGDFQAAVTAFQDQAAELKRKTREAFHQQLDPSPYSSLVSEIITQLREANIDPREMNDHADAVLMACIDRCSQVVQDVQGRYSDEMYRIVTEFSAGLGKSLSVQVQTPISGVTASHVSSLNMQFNGFEQVRNSLYGGLAGAMMANIGVQWILLPVAAAFPPAALVAAVAAVAATVALPLFGVWKASDSLKSRRQEEALAKLTSVLSDAVRRAQGQALRQFEQISTEYEKGVRDSLRRATAEVDKEITDKIHSITEQRQRSREEATLKTETLKKLLDQADGVLRSIAHLMQPAEDKQ